MAVQIKHAFVSAKGDGTDATLLKPSDWNASHTTSMANNSLLGNISGSPGPFTEIGLTPFMAALLGAADATALASMLGLFSTGDVKWTLAASPPAGWILCNNGGTIGNAASGASIRANADTQALFELVWNNVAQVDAPITSGSRGASATIDFNNNKQLQLPFLAGRSPMGAGGSVGGLSSRNLGRLYGEESHTLAAAEIPSITSTVSVSGSLSGSTVTTNLSTSNNSTGGGTFTCGGAVGSTSLLVNVSGTLAGGSSSNNTGGGAHNTIHPVVALNPMVKL